MDKSLDELRDALRLCKGRWHRVCEGSGLDYSWLTKFAQGRIKNPGYEKVQRLDRYLAENGAGREGDAA